MPGLDGECLAARADTVVLFTRLKSFAGIAAFVRKVRWNSRLWWWLRLPRPAHYVITIIMSILYLYALLYRSLFVTPMLSCLSYIHAVRSSYMPIVCFHPIPCQSLSHNHQLHFRLCLVHRCDPKSAFAQSQQTKINPSQHIFSSSDSINKVVISPISSHETAKSISWSLILPAGCRWSSIHSRSSKSSHTICDADF